jgi:integrase
MTTASLNLGKEINTEGRPYYNFINSLKSQETKNGYNKSLRKYMQHYKITDVNKLLTFSITEMENMLTDYLLDLQQKDLSSSYVNLNFCALKHFYFMNDIRINDKKISKFLGEKKRKNTDRGYTHEEIKKLLDVSDLRLKVAISVIACTGMRIGAITPLKLSHVKKVENVNANIYKFIVYENAIKDEYITFSTPECSAYIDSYFDYRKRCGEQLNDDSPFIREQFDVNDFEQIRKHGRHVSQDTISNIIGDLAIKAGLREINHSFTGKERKAVPLNHGFRKFWTTQAIKSKVITEARLKLEGHKQGITTSYYRPTEEELLTEYLKAVNNLTIEESNRLRKQITELEQKQSEIDLIKYKHEQEMKGVNEQLDRLGAAYSKFTKAFALNEQLHEQDMIKYNPEYKPLTDKQKEFIRKNVPHLFQ